MVLPELSGHIAERLEQFGDGGIFLLQAFRRARETNFGEASADGRLGGNKSRTPGGTALLRVPVCEERTFAGKAVDVGRLVTHHTLVVGTDVPVTDVISP